MVIHMRGLIKELAEKYGTSIHEIKRKIMETIIAVAKRLKAEGMDWFKALHYAGKTTWAIIRETKTIPTPEQVLAQIGSVAKF